MTVTANRSYKINFCGCTTSKTSNIDIDVILSPTSITAKASHVNGEGYSSTTSTAKMTLYYESGSLYLETSTYGFMTVTSYNVDIDMEAITSIPSTATAVSLE